MIWYLQSVKSHKLPNAKPQHTYTRTDRDAHTITCIFLYRSPKKYKLLHYSLDKYIIISLALCRKCVVFGSRFADTHTYALNRTRKHTHRSGFFAVILFAIISCTQKFHFILLENEWAFQIKWNTRLNISTPKIKKHIYKKRERETEQKIYFANVQQARRQCQKLSHICLP